MTLTQSNSSIQRLLSALPRGEPVETSTLAAHGVSPQLASYLAKSGWLQHLSRGVYLLVGDQPSRDGCLTFLARRTPGLHVGGKTALAWRGVRHNLPTREQLELWGDRPVRLPAWLTAHHPCSYQTTQLFDSNLPAGFGLQPLPETPAGPLVSVPERALLEMLCNVGKQQSVEDARNLTESLHNPRPEVLDTLLTHCTRIKVVRLARQFADELELPWAKIIHPHSQRMGSDRRWMLRTRNGELLSLKK
jgi:hypothetical protein